MSHFHQEFGKDQSSFLPHTSLELLKYWSTRIKRRRDDRENPNDQITSIDAHAPEPASSSPSSTTSTVRIIKLAKEQLAQLKSSNSDIISSVFSYLEAQVSQELVIALLLQAAAEKVDDQQYVYARKLLSICSQFACKDGISPIQRVTHYFVQALLEKTDRESGILPNHSSGEYNKKTMDEKLALLNLHPEILAGQQENPFSLVTQFMAVGTIRDSLASAKKVHLIDFSLDNGSHWTLFMQDFAATGGGGGQLKRLRITAVGTSKIMLEDTGKRLESFAESLNLPFSFNVVVSDLKDLRRDLFRLEDDETVAVYSATRLWTLLAWPNYLESLIVTIKSLRPRLMVVKEMEASTNKNNFMERFDEALIYVAGVFDIAKDCMEDRALYRKHFEEVCCGNIIQNVVTAEGAQRIHRYEKIEFWRALFGKFDVVETELSRSSLRRTKLLLKRSARFDSFTLEADGKCLVLGWKGTPFLSVSAWKFPKDTK